MNALATEPEVWLIVHGYEGLYEASNLGRIRSLPRATTRGKVLKPRRVKMALTVCLSRENIRRGYAVHRLVARAFLGPRPAHKDLVAHWDGDFRNNRASNLRYATYEENEADKRRHGRNAEGERNPSVKITAHDVREIRRSAKNGVSARELAARYPVGTTQIYNIIRGVCWSDKGNAQRRSQRRRQKLRAEGLIVDSGMRREDPETGKCAVVWAKAS